MKNTTWHWLSGTLIGLLIPAALALGLPILKGLNYQPAVERYYRAMALPASAILLDVLLSFVYAALLLWAGLYAVQHHAAGHVKWIYACGIVMSAAATCLAIFPFRFSNAAKVDLTGTFTMGGIAAGGYLLILIYLLFSRKARPTA